MRTRSIFVLTIITALGPLGCGGGGGSPTPTTPSTPTTPTPTTPTPTTPTPTTPTPTATNDVVVENNDFAPAAVTVPVGATVRWTWSTCTAGGTSGYGGADGESCVDHSVTWDGTGSSSSVTQSKGTYQRVFDAKGTFTYHCAVHGAAMSGRVVVQ
jgi:plastocyanin